jgi:hypothetical protein
MIPDLHVRSKINIYDREFPVFIWLVVKDKNDIFTGLGRNS